MENRSGVFCKIFSSGCCFSFVYIWHGIKANIMVWSLLNFLGIAVETLGKSLWKNEAYQKMEKSILSPRGSRRLHAAIASPLTLLSVISNMYFLIDQEAGDIFLIRAFNSWPYATPLTLLFMYCLAQTSIEMKNYDIKKKHQALLDRKV